MLLWKQVSGCCGVCEKSFHKQVQTKSIPYSHNQAMIPICTLCYDKMTFEEIRMTIKSLINIWIKNDPVNIEDHKASMNQAIGWVRCDKGEYFDGH